MTYDMNSGVNVSSLAWLFSSLSALPTNTACSPQQCI